jgi:hypothetical protein
MKIVALTGMPSCATNLTAGQCPLATETSRATALPNRCNGLKIKMDVFVPMCKTLPQLWGSPLMPMNATWSFGHPPSIPQHWNWLLVVLNWQK